MLILTDADGFRVDLDELGEWVLQAAGDGRRASLTNVKVRELLGSELARGVDGGSCLVDDYVGEVPVEVRTCAARRRLALELFDEVNDDLLGLARCGAVADGDDVDVIFVHKFFQGVFGIPDFFVICRSCRENDHRIKDFARRIDNSQFAPCAEGGIPAEDAFACNGRLHQQLCQVLAEDRDGSFLGVGSHLAADVVLDRRGDEALVGVAGSFLQVLAGHGMLRYADLEVQVGLDVFDRSLDPEAEDFFLLAAVHREDAVTGDVFERLVVVVVVFVNGFLGVALLG